VLLASKSLAKSRETRESTGHKTRSVPKQKRTKTNKKIGKMTPRESERSGRRKSTTGGGLVTDGETTDEETEEASRHDSQQNCPSLQGRMSRRFDGQEVWEARIGDHCVILVGKTGQDIGQQGLITEIKPVMVEVEYRDGRSRKMVVKNKRPSSLLMLEEGLEIVRDKKGTLWVRQSETTAR
jgi:L-fucose isomerase-like protein